jgi:hypothetical protein
MGDEDGPKVPQKITYYWKGPTCRKLCVSIMLHGMLEYLD